MIKYFVKMAILAIAACQDDDLPTLPIETQKTMVKDEFMIGGTKVETNDDGLITNLNDKSDKGMSGDGYKVVNKCDFPSYFTEGIKVLDDGKHMLLSSGQFGQSKLVLLSIDVASCKFKMQQEVPLE